MRTVRVRWLAAALVVMLLAAGGVYAVFSTGEGVPFDRVALMARGDAALERGDLEGARQAYGGIVEGDRGDAEAAVALLRVRSRLAGTKRRRERVFLDVESLLRRFPERTDARRLLVDLAMDLERFHDALVQLRRLRGEHDDERVRLLEARCLEMLGRDGEAIDVLEETARLFPRSVTAHAHAAELLARTLRYGEAERVAARLGETLPTDPAALRARIDFERRHGDVRRAVPLAERLCTVTGRDGEAVRLLVGVLLEASEVSARGGDLTAGVSLRRRADEVLEESAGRPVDDRGLALLVAERDWRAGRREEAVARLLRWPTEEGDDDFAGVLVEMHVQRGDSAAARAALSHVASPSNAAYLRGRVAMGEGRWDEAVERLVEARRGAAGDAGLAERIELACAESSIRIGNAGDARLALHRALRVSPRSVSARLGLAVFAESAGNREGAVAEYRSLLPEGVAVSRLVELLVERNVGVPSIARHWGEVDELVALAAAGATAPGEAARLREWSGAARRGERFEASRRPNPTAWRPRFAERAIDVALQRIEDGERTREPLRLGS